MNKTLRSFTLFTLFSFAIFVVFVSFSHLYCYALGKLTQQWFEIIDLYIPTIFGIVGSLLTIPTVIFAYRTTLTKTKKLFFALSLIFFSAMCITFVINMIANKVFYLNDNHTDYSLYIHHTIRPKIVSSFVLLFLILSICSIVLFFIIKTSTSRRPTKAERLQSQIDELQKQVDELKKGE